LRRSYKCRNSALSSAAVNRSDSTSDSDTAVSFRRDYRPRDEQELALHDDLATDVELVKFTPGMDTALLEAAAENSDGLVVEGTGLGHVDTDLISVIEELDIPVVMTSQCLEGRVCDRVYDTGRDLLDAGVIEGEDMLPGTAKVKLMWSLANSAHPEKTVREPVAGEIQDRSVPWE